MHVFGAHQFFIQDFSEFTLGRLLPGKLVRIDECGVWHKTLLCLNPHAAVHPVPSQVVRCSVEDCGFESVWRLKFEIEQACFRGAKAMLGRSEEPRLNSSHTV